MTGPAGVRPSPRPALTAVGIVILMCVGSWWSERPPAALPLDTPPERFSAARAVRLLGNVAARPHMPGSAEHRRVREYLVSELRDMGLEVEVHQATVTSSFGRAVRAVTVRNVVARLRGTDSTGGVALAAHYDSQQLPAGAGDDGTGVVAILETLRALQHHPPLRNDLYVVITDAEELGLMGARGFVAEHPWWGEIEVLLSFEARGAAGQAVMFETNAENGWVVREFARADPYPTGSSLYYEIYRRLPNDTDFSVYKRAGVTGLNFAMAEGADRYHRTIDTVENLSPATVQHHGEHALSLARHLGNLDLSGSNRSPDIVFFRAGPLGLITYSAAWAFPLALLTAGMVAMLIMRGRQRRLVTLSGVGAGLALAVASISVSAGSAWLLWTVVRGAHHELGSIVGRALYDESWYGLAIAALSTAAVGLLFGSARRRFDAASLAFGALLVPLGMALVTGWVVPGVSMLFQWPAVFSAVAVAFLMARVGVGRGDEVAPRATVELIVLGICCIPVVFILFPLVWALYIGLNVSAAPVIGGMIALLLVLLLPLFEIAQRDRPWWLPATACALGVFFAVAGVYGARPGPQRPIPSDLVYALDRESGEAVWATMQPGSDGWIERFVATEAAEGDLAPFLAGNRRSYRASAAPAVDAPRARVEVISDVTDGAVRTVRLEIRSMIGPELINVSLGEGDDLRLIAVNGVPVDDSTVGGPGRGGADWLLQHYGEPPAGVLTIDLQPGRIDEPASVVVVEYLMRLPPVPGLDLERPPGWVAHAGRLTDVSLFRQVEWIESAGRSSGPR